MRSSFSLGLAFKTGLTTCSRQPRLPRVTYTTMAQPVVERLRTTDTLENIPHREHLPVRTFQSLALSESEDDSAIRQKYRPFILSNITEEDWVSDLELTTALKMAQNDLKDTNQRLKVLVLYGSLRKRSYSRLVAMEACRILFRLGCDVRVFDPEGLPVKNDVDHGHPKVQELRGLSQWSDGHVWVSPEQHGNLVSIPSPRLFHPMKYYFHLLTRVPCLDRSVQEPDRLDPP